MGVTLGFNSFTPASGVSVVRPETYGAVRSSYAYGTATGGDTGTIQKTGAFGVTNRWQTNAGADVYYQVVITAGTNAGESRQVISSTPDTLTVDEEFPEPIDSTSEYFVAFDSSYAINAAINHIATRGVGGTTLFSNGASYFIGHTVNWLPGGGWLQGEYGGSQLARNNPPEVRWVGQAMGTMVDHNTAGAFIQYLRMNNLVWRGMALNIDLQEITTAAGIILDIDTKMDHGSGFEDVWFKQCQSHPWIARRGGINVAMRRTRWDNSPYPAKWMVIGGDSLWIEAVTGDESYEYGYYPYLGVGRGWLEIDAVTHNPGANGGMWLTVKDATLEVHHDQDPDYGIITYHAKQDIAAMKPPQLFFTYDNIYVKPNASAGGPTVYPFLRCDPPSDMVIINHGIGYNMQFDGIPHLRQDGIGTTIGLQGGLTAPFHKLMNVFGSQQVNRTGEVFNSSVDLNGPIGRFGHRAGIFEWVTFSAGVPTYDAGDSRQVYSGDMFADASEIAASASGTTAIAICGIHNGNVKGGQLADPALITGVTVTSRSSSTSNFDITNAAPFKMGDFINIGANKTQIVFIDYDDNTISTNPGIASAVSEAAVTWLTPVWRTGTLGTT